MIHRKNMKGQDLSGVYCAILIVSRSIVPAGLFHVLESEIVGVSVATSHKHDGK
ncbi:hypothetical protein A2U01_0020518, partial [Trifolium medium]|nr:hypothetical protein [Trifolium medium]